MSELVPYASMNKEMETITNNNGKPTNLWQLRQLSLTLTQKCIQDCPHIHLSGCLGYAAFADVNLQIYVKGLLFLQSLLFLLIVTVV